MSRLSLAPAVAFFLVAVIVLAAPAARRARAAAVDRLLAGHIDQIVPTRAGMAALRDGEVLVVDGWGRVLGRSGEPEAPASAPARTAARRDGLDAEDFLRAAGFSADDDSPEAEGMLDDEGLLRPRRGRRPAESPAVPHQIAAARDGDTLWIATSSGLRRARADGTGAAPAAFDQQDVRLVAAQAAVVVAVVDTTIWRSRDGGRRFQAEAVLPFAPRALALGDDGARLFVAGDDGVLEIVERQLVRLLDRPTDALAACGGTVLALADDGAYAWTIGNTPGETAGETPAGRARRPPARRLGCRADARGSWVATGVGLWTSPDGVAWNEEPVGLGLSIAAAALVGDRWWLATSDGLLAVVASEPPAAVATARDAGRTSPSLLGSGRAARTWALALPHVTLAVGGRHQTATSGEWHAWLILTIPLGPKSASGLRRAAVVGELARRRAALALDQQRLMAGQPDDEREAMLRATRDEIEGLR